MYRRAAQAYRKVHVESAPKSRIVDELFNRFLRDVGDARAAIDRGDVAGKSEATDHALRIVTELSAALDTRAAPELCANLERLYDFVGQQIGEASRNMDSTPLAPAERVMTTLRDAFAQAAQAREQGPTP